MRDISHGFGDIKRRVALSCKRKGRNPEDVVILAVSKTVDTARIREAYGLGLRDFGENKVQEFISKHEELGDLKGINWHITGHLQTNKVKYLPGKTHLIHSLDRMRLAGEIDRRMGLNGFMARVLIQVNVAREATKSGIYPEDVGDFLHDMGKFKNIKVKGLMTIAPDFDDPEQTRPIFRHLNKIFVDMGDKNIDNVHMKYLSMGMSKDFEVAIEEGANIIRIGRGIFGDRTYK